MKVQTWLGIILKYTVLKQASKLKKIQKIRERNGIYLGRKRTRVTFSLLSISLSKMDKLYLNERSNGKKIQDFYGGEWLMEYKKGGEPHVQRRKKEKKDS